MVVAKGARGGGLRLQQQWQWCRQPTVAMVGAGNGGRSGGSARADNNQPKKWHQRCSKYYFKCNILNITWLWRQEQGAAVCGCGDSFNGVDSQSNFLILPWPDSYFGDALQDAKQLFLGGLPQMTKYFGRRECDNISTWYLFL